MVLLLAPIYIGPIRGALKKAQFWGAQVRPAPSELARPRQPGTEVSPPTRRGRQPNLSRPKLKYGEVALGLGEAASSQRGRPGVRQGRPAPSEVVLGLGEAASSQRGRFTPQRAWRRGRPTQVPPPPTVRRCSWGSWHSAGSGCTAAGRTTPDPYAPPRWRSCEPREGTSPDQAALPGFWGCWPQPESFGLRPRLSAFSICASRHLRLQASLRIKGFQMQRFSTEPTTRAVCSPEKSTPCP